MKVNSTGKQHTFYFWIIVQLLCGFCNYGNICCNVNINYVFFFACLYFTLVIHLKLTNSWFYHNHGFSYVLALDYIQALIEV